MNHHADDKTHSDAVDTFVRFMEAHHRRKTPERFAILDMALAIPGHFTVDELMRRMNEGPLTVSRATVYNTINLLLDCGLVRCHRFEGRNTPEYEMVTGRRASHLHLVCQRCGKVREVADMEIMRLVNLRRYETFTPEYFELSVYGLCSRCQRKRKSKRAHK